MAGCCDPRGCDRMFTAGFAEHRARQYRKSGLDRAQRRMVSFLEPLGIEHASVLEVGGGVGELPIDLLRRGGATATEVELVRTYDEPAAALATEAGVADRINRVIGDVAVDPSLVGPADLVMLHRVVCCYPDVEGLLAACARLTRRALVLTHPPHHVLARGGVRLINAMQWMMQREYRAFDHDPELMTEVLRAGGLRVTHRRRGAVWQVLGATRP